jgi:2-C-methyl-D-erythritol 4-phosphate cytidylyltransferase
MPTAAILTAAGSGTRLGLPGPKALVELAGVPLVVHAARRLAASGVVLSVVVTVPPGRVGGFRALLGGPVRHTKNKI